MYSDKVTSCHCVCTLWWCGFYIIIIHLSLYMKDPSVQDDILLEVVMLCGTFSLDEHCATLLVKAGLSDLLITILKG